MDVDSKVNVLVTGIGAIIGYGIIKSLRVSGLNVNIVGMDIYRDAVGQYWCDSFVQAILASDKNYISFLKNVMDNNDIDIVFFGTEQEIYRCAEAKEELGRCYDKLVINNLELLDLAKDKWKTREALIAYGMSEYAIPSEIKGSYAELAAVFGKTFLLKPRHSYAAKGIHQVDNQDDFDFYKRKMESDFMAQRLIGDAEHEYTVGAFCTGDGCCRTMIQLKRKLSQEGATAKAELIIDDAITDAVNHLCKLFRPIGPANFQFRKEGDRCFLLEINPRISSSTSIRTALGYNEAKMCVDYFLSNKFEIPIIKHGHAVRFIDEVVIINE
ncbi:hypothetical protein IMSAGC020_00138 [Lachnospiraceae bacterium]|nr:hypothetical protein IMSAGC020_00138 [Lachnospiraceae bacterium]